MAMNIAFTCMDGGLWTAGDAYLRNLAFVLETAGAGEEPVQIYLLRSRRPSGTAGIPDDSETSVIDIPPAGGWASPTIAKRVIRRLCRQLRPGIAVESPVSMFLRTKAVDVVFSNADMGPQFQIPLLCWIPDFQHRHLPHMFSEDERQGRDRIHLNIAKRAGLVILSSETARGDFETFYPEYASKSRVLPFVASVDAGIYDRDPRRTLQRYNLPDKFIFLPNQFWRHKNHMAMLEAVVVARRQCPDIAVICTGNTSDYRHPNYFDALSTEDMAQKLAKAWQAWPTGPDQQMEEEARKALPARQHRMAERFISLASEVIGMKRSASDECSRMQRK